MAIYNGKEGVWRTVGGRRIFIADGEDLATAMKNSGKFKTAEEKEFDKKYKIFEDDFYKEWNERGYNFDSKTAWGVERRLSVEDRKTGEIVGQIKWQEVHNFSKTYLVDKVNIVNINVKEEYRRQGIATRLYKEVQKIAGDNDINFGEVSSDGLKLLKRIADIYPTTDKKHYKGRIK